MSMRASGRRGGEGGCTDLTENADGVSKEVKAAHDLVQLPQKRSDIVTLKGIREL